MRRLGLGIALLLAAVWAAPAHAVPACFAAAARDPETPCSNPTLRLAARPGLTAALITPSYPCTGTGTVGDPNSRIDGALFICAFGTPEESATRTVALVGDSHAMAWRAGVAGAFRRLGWRGLDMTRSHCAFSASVRDLDEAEEVIGCVRFNVRVIDWLEAHPEVTAVVVGHQTAGTPYIAPPGLTSFEAETVGFQAAWEALPPSVEQVLAIRDNPAQPQRDRGRGLRPPRPPARRHARRVLRPAAAASPCGPTPSWAPSTVSATRATRCWT